MTLTIVNAILRKAGKADRLDIAARMAMDTDFGDHCERNVKVDRELMPIVDLLGSSSRATGRGVTRRQQAES